MNSNANFWNQAAIEDSKTAVWGEADCDWDLKADEQAELIVDWLGCTGEDLRIVDFGCGIGRLSWRVAERLNASVVGVDISDEMLKQAKQHDKVKYVLSNGKTWDIESDSIDGVYSMLVIQHLDPRTVAANVCEIRRVLKPGGRFLVQYVRGTNISQHMYDYTDDEMIDIAETVGLTVDFVWQHRNGLVYPEWSWIKGSA